MVKSDEIWSYQHPKLRGYSPLSDKAIMNNGEELNQDENLQVRGCIIFHCLKSCNLEHEHNISEQLHLSSIPKCK